MIRGYIEVVTDEVVQGWIHCAEGTTRDKLLLAFCGDQCVGSGKVDRYRRDLAEAGLGDGYLGFSFGLTISPQDVGSVVVKFEGSDAVLLQPGAVVRAASDAAHPPTHVTLPPEDRAAPSRATVDRQLAALAWGLKHARLAQAEHDFLRLLWSFGIYERSLLRREAPGKATVADPPIAVATELLESYLGADAEINVVTSITALTFRDEMAKVVADARWAPVVALYGTDRVTIRALEGSHIKDESAKTGLRRGNYVDHKINPEHLVVLDARAAAELYAPAGHTISMLTASPVP